jgi:hypothetical protein
MKKMTFNGLPIATLFIGIFAIACTKSGVDVPTVTDGASVITQKPIDEWFVNIGTVAALVLVIIEFVKTKTTVSGFKLHWLSWALAVAIAVIGQLAGLGMFAGLDIVSAIVAGVMAGASANGIADWQLMQKVFGFVKPKIKK